MTEIVLGTPLIHLPTTTSTMDDVLELARAGSPEGVTVVADVQTAGQGRAGRVWETSPEDALLMSFLLRPDRPAADLVPLSLLTALAIAETVRDEYAIDARIKWPNDVLVDGKKLCGILLRTHMLPGERHPIVVIGTGINANGVPPHVAETATHVAAHVGWKISRDELRIGVLSHLSDIYARFLAGDSALDWARINALLMYRGEPVTVQDGDRVIAGTVEGIGARGELFVREASGEVRTIVAGDLTRGPRPA